MENWTQNPDIITILNYLGYTECTTEDKIRWLNCKTVERLERITPSYHPLYQDKKREPLFYESLSLVLDWDKLIKICNEIGINSITTNKDEAIKTIAEKIKTLPVLYLCDECEWSGKHSDMKVESDFGYDQSCCPTCNNVMVDNLHGILHCEKISKN